MSAYPLYIRVETTCAVVVPCSGARVVVVGDEYESVSEGRLATRTVKTLFIVEPTNTHYIVAIRDALHDFFNLKMQ